MMLTYFLLLNNALSMFHITPINYKSYKFITLLKKYVGNIEIFVGHS
jgi:hypothetical protein